MDPIRLFYVWSPKYEIFHHILRSSLSESPDFIVQPIFVPQEVFDQTSYRSNSDHFLDGNSVKLNILISILQKHPGETILIVDADTIIENPEFLRLYLESYRQYDIVFAKSSLEKERELSMGFGMVRSTPDTIQYFQDSIQIISSTGKNDMDVLNETIQTFKGTYGMFTFPEIIQTQHYSKFKGQYYAIQLTCSNHKTYEENLFEKLVSAASLIDITEIVPLIPIRVFNAMLDFYRDRDPSHYLLRMV